MYARRLLYYTANSHQVYLWRSGKLELEGVFAADDEGVTEFRSFAKLHAKSIFYILADLAGEDFHDEMIPRLRGRDRQMVIERRLAQRYKDTRLVATLSLGKVALPGVRSSERLVLTSFTNAQQFSPWLDALTDAGAKLAGVYSVPLVAPAVASKLAAKTGARNSRTIVVSMNGAGLRQSFLEDGRLRFARLEHTGKMTPESLAALARSETLRLIQYLSNLRVLPLEGPPITAIVVAPAGQHGIFEQTLVSDGQLTFQIVDLVEAARSAGIKRAEGIGAEQLYLHLLARSAPKVQFARTEDRKDFLLWQLQRGLVAAGAFGLAAGVAFAGVKWLDVLSVRDQTALQKRETRNVEHEYQRVTATFPVTQTSTQNLKITVNEFRAIAARSAAPGPAFIYVSRALEQFPQIELNRLAWHVERPGATEKGAPGPAATAPATTPATETVAQMLEISGYVTNTQRSDYRAITALVQHFADALRLDQSYEVVRTQLPFDTTPTGTLSGDIGTAESGVPPRFTITLSRKVSK